MLKLKIHKKVKEDGKISYYAPITSEFKGRKTTYYLLINFKRGIELEDTAFVEVKSFFLSSYWCGEARLKMIITEYEIVEDSSGILDDYKNEKEQYADFGDIEIDDSQISF